MTIPASQALAYTNNAIQLTSSAEVAREIQLTESFIRTATSQERFKVTYNARIVGNPAGDPFDDDLLSPVQIEYRDAWVLAGYAVSRDEDTGYWVISWEPVGAESTVTQYSVRTTLSPGTVSQLTIDQLNLFFAGVVPAATSDAFIVPINGGDIDENDFGAPISVYYEYIVLVSQSVTTDYSDDMKVNLIANVTGYDTFNLMVYKFN